jgi:uncharacterized membrane protein YdbT with pleckstrin-like domain
MDVLRIRRTRSRIHANAAHDFPDAWSLWGSTFLTDGPSSRLVRKEPLLSRPDWLQPDESVLHTTGRHPLSIIDTMLWTILFFGGSIGGLWFATMRWVPDLRPYAWAGTIFLLFLFALSLLALYWRVVTSRYVVTEDRVYRAHGRLRFFLTQTTYDKLTDLHVQQSLFGRIWGFGTVTAQTAGTGLSMEGVRDPFGMKRRIEEARRRFIDRLLEEHGIEKQAAAARADAERKAEAERRAAAGEAPEADAEEPSEWRPVERTDVVLWRGGPVVYTLIPAFVTGLFMLGVGAMMTLGGTLGEDGGLLVLLGPLLILFGLNSMVQGFIAYRFTRYEVAPWGVVVTSGWLTRRRVETTFDKVTDVSTYQGLIGRMLDYGNIKINTAGSNQAPVNFNGLSQPERVKELIDQVRRKTDRERRQR